MAPQSTLPTPVLSYQSSTDQASRARFRLGGILTTTLLLCGSVGAQSSKDQLGWIDKSGRAKTFTGIVTENTLARTVIQVGDTERTVEGEAVTLVSFGAVPPAYKEGVAYFDRRDFATAAARFQVAATDASANDAVKAEARFRAGEAWMHASGTVNAAFVNAGEQLERFISDYPEGRALPKATLFLGRAKWLSGNPEEAAVLLRGLYQERQKPGYPATVCFGAGVVAAQAYISAGDVKNAKSLFAEVQPALAAHLASLDNTDSTRFALSGIEADALLGEGFCLLAEGKAAQAKSYFSSKLSAAPKSDSLLYGARLGLAESLLATGETRAAQIEFAVVSALDHSSKDRLARALIGLTECALNLPDSTSRQDAKLWLKTIQDQYGDTPSVQRAIELAKSL